MRLTAGSAGSLLPNYGVVLLDEAHTLEDNAATISDCTSRASESSRR